MKTRNTTHLGDGVYVGQDEHLAGQIWIGANHHENMTVALGAWEVKSLVEWIRKVDPQMAAEAGL